MTTQNLLLSEARYPDWLVALMAGELNKMLSDLVAALGGEISQEAA